MMVSAHSFALLAPEIALVVAALIAYLAAAFAGVRTGWTIAVVGVLGAMLLLSNGQGVNRL